MGERPRCPHLIVILTLLGCRASDSGARTIAPVGAMPAGSHDAIGRRRLMTPPYIYSVSSGVVFPYHTRPARLSSCDGGIDAIVAASKELSHVERCGSS